MVRIDLGDGRCAYGRQLTGVAVEFFDRVGAAGELVDLLELVTAPVAFTIWVADRAFRRSGGWELLDAVTLSQEEASRTYRFAKQDAISRRLSIYTTDPVSGTYGETPASLEECQGLERAAVWGVVHVEDRLRDHFDGRPNRWVESMRLRP
ncbi:hypothetical protein JOL79_14485 [Microbispora sp. RL4-1S]|uniref:Uncharacterized protein n=1 Tax=Microbispora oryzae TaxID=2806554 RepID=A0A940WKL3_9ACTN|nr:Imm26 family immunity protein [Microbispora oryzae]MBP2705022.1 hypothetical protein [Microbispora oryzae]